MQILLLLLAIWWQAEPGSSATGSLSSSFTVGAYRNLYLTTWWWRSSQSAMDGGCFIACSQPSCLACSAVEPKHVKTLHNNEMQPTKCFSVSELIYEEGNRVAEGFSLLLLPRWRPLPPHNTPTSLISLEHTWWISLPNLFVTTRFVPQCRATLVMEVKSAGFPFKVAKTKTSGLLSCCEESLAEECWSRQAVAGLGGGKAFGGVGQMCEAEVGERLGWIGRRRRRNSFGIIWGKLSHHAREWSRQLVWKSEWHPSSPRSDGSTSSHTFTLDNSPACDGRPASRRKSHF